LVPLEIRLAPAQRAIQRCLHLLAQMLVPFEPWSRQDARMGHSGSARISVKPSIGRRA